MTVEGMVRGVAQAAVFILILTTGVWRPFVALEVRAAIHLKKKILLIHEEDPRRSQVGRSNGPIGA